MMKQQPDGKSGAASASDLTRLLEEMRGLVRMNALAGPKIVPKRVEDGAVETRDDAEQMFDNMPV